MSNQLDLAVQAALYPTEKVKITLATRTVPSVNSDSKTPDRREAQDGTSTESNRILAVISHLDPRTEEEQGCIFVIEKKASKSTLSSDDYAIEQLHPIAGDFSISMAQPRRATLDLRPSAISTSMTQPPRTELALTIRSKLNDEPLTLSTYDTERLRIVLAECKRIKQLSAQANSTPVIWYSWLNQYTPDLDEPSILSPIPHDLRSGLLPLHTTLSRASAGFPGDDIDDIVLIRKDYIRSRVVQACTDTASKTMIKLRIGTFNVNGRLPSQDLSAWVQARTNSERLNLIPPLKTISPLSLGDESPIDISVRQRGTIQDDVSVVSDLPGSSACGAAGASSNSTLSGGVGPHMLVLGFQEIDLSTEALLYSTSTVREDAWCAAVLAGLGEKAVLYQKLVSKQLVGMLLVIFVRKDIVHCFSDIAVSAAGAGIMGMMGNKGATAVRVRFTPETSDSKSPRSTVFTFVNAHLAAFDDMFEKRNSDFHDLSKRIVFDSGIPVDVSAQPEGYASVNESLSVFQSDILFWMGDLNYRISLPDADVRELLASEYSNEAIPLLRKYDQLNMAMRTKLAFEGFTELSATYPPSYRFSSGVLTDSQGYDIKRKPAWTDRILHFASSQIKVKQCSYSSHRQITMSDHKPVSADYEIEMPVVDSVKYGSLVKSIWRQVANCEHPEDSPKLKILSSTIDFGAISFLALTDLYQPCLGRPSASQPECSSRRHRLKHIADPPWLSIEPLAGFLLPGDSASVALSAYVDAVSAKYLNLGPFHLEDTLILHTALGKDDFISVAAEYQRTCFATSLERLIRLPCPIRALKNLTDLLPADQALNAPNEIMRLVNWLMSHTADFDNLFWSPAADEDLLTRIRECLDTGAKFIFPGLNAVDSQLPPAFAQTLLLFLESLPEPIVPVSMHSRCAQVETREEAFELLSDLSSASINVWISITSYLHFISQQKETNGSNLRVASRLALVFAPILLPGEPSSLPISVIGNRNFLLHFIS